MSIATTTRKAGPFTGNGVTTVFPFSFKVFAAADLTVTSATGGVETTLVLNSNYSVTLNSNQDTSPGGNVTLFVAPSSSFTVTITSAVAQTQPVVLTNNGGFYPTVINNALDRLTILIQQLAEGLSRSLKITLSSSTAISTTLPAPSPNKAIGWNATGDGFANLDVTSGGGGGGAVSSVNGQTGAVVLTAAGLGAVTSVNGQTGPAVTLVTGVSSVNGSTGAVTVTPASISAVATAARGTANGVASLDSSGLVPSSQLPTTGSYKGTWNATTNTPTIVSGVGVNGDFYKVATAGSTTIDGVSSWAIGDEIRFGTSTWQKIANSAAVSSVNSLTGAVVITAASLGAATTATLAASGGSDTIGYVSGGTSPVATTVQAKLRQTVSVKDYGAVGNGVANDTVAIQRALDANVGGEVVIPVGTFLVSSLTLTAGQALVGENRQTSILKLNTALSGNGMINATNQEGVVVENLTIDGGSLNGSKNTLINFFGCHGARIENNNFINVDQLAVGCNSMSYWTVRGNRFLLTQRVGAWIKKSSISPQAPANVATPPAVTPHSQVVGSSSLVGVVSAPTGAGGIQASFTYGLNDLGQVVASSIIFQTNGKGYITDPTVSFPAAPATTATGKFGGAQVVAITGSASTVVGEGVEISHNYFEGGGVNTSLRHSVFCNNVSRNVIYGAAFVSEQATNVGRNTYINNTITNMGYCTIAGTPYVNTYIGPDTDDTVSSGVELWGFYENFSNNLSYYNAGDGISFGSRGGTCSNNLVYDNGQYWAALTIPNYNTYGIKLPAGNPTYNPSGSLITNNRSFDQNGASGKQGYGIGVAGSAVTEAKIVDNDCINNRVGTTNLDSELSGTLSVPTVLREINASSGGVSLATTAPAAVGTTAVVGVGTTAARADHVHAHGAQTDGTLHAAATTSVAGFMSAADKTKLDSTATLSSAIPASVGAQTAGVATTASRSDHIHDHGNQTAGTHHAAATTSVAGFMSTTDKTKLDSLSTAVATTTVNGLMSAADKTKLDAVSNGAIVTTSQSFPGATITSGAIAGQGATLAGVAFGDYLDVSFSFPLLNCTAMAFVTAANGVQCIFTNNTGASVTLAAGTIYFRAMKR